MLGFSSLEDEQHFHGQLCWGMLLLSPIIFLILRYVFPPSWGKNFQALLGVTFPPRLGWCLFELPNLYWAAICYYHSPEDLPLANTLLLTLFAGHYINRAIIYPLTLNPHSKRLPLEIVLSAFLYTNLNGYVQARALCQFYDTQANYHLQPRFWVGVLLFGIGVSINWQSDDILRNLRTSKPKTEGSGYVIPYGGFFQFVSSPHYFGEILEWTGFALAGQSWAAWSFMAFTCANLIPRAVATHEWYLNHFKDYPVERKAVIPFLW